MKPEKTIQALKPSLSARKELLNMLRVMWRKGDSSLRRIYPSWEELEANLEITVREKETKTLSTEMSCPYCGVIQKIEKPIDELFPYDSCQSCKRPFHLNNDLNFLLLHAIKLLQYLPQAYDFYHYSKVCLLKFKFPV